MKSIDGCSSVNAPDICDSNGARMDELGEADRIGSERERPLPSHLQLQSLTFLFPIPDAKRRKRVVEMYLPCVRPGFRAPLGKQPADI